MTAFKQIRIYLGDIWDLLLRLLEIICGSEARAGILQMVFIAPFEIASWIYQKVKQRFFKPNPMSLYAIMIERTESTEWFIRCMKAKGWTQSEEAAYRRRIP